MLRKISAASMALVLAACATAEKESVKKQWSQGVIVALDMCARDGSAQHTKDPEGRRAYCQREEVLGSHFAKCVCRDENQAVEERDESQQFMRNEASRPQNMHGN